MDAQLTAHELEMTLLAKLLESKMLDASSNLMMPAAALLHLMRSYLGPDVTLADLEAAAQLSPVLTWTPYLREITVAGVSSRHGVRLRVYAWAPSAASQHPFEQRLRAHAERPRPPIAATSYSGGALGTTGVSFEVRNEGYGDQADIRVTGVEAPDWIAPAWHGNIVSLAARPTRAGVYRGQVCVQTNANALVLPVSTQSADFALPARDELTLDELLPDHPDLDRRATEQALDALLTRLGYERLPGGLFIRRGLHPAPARTEEWWITQAMLESGSLPASGYPERFTVYGDANGVADKYDAALTYQYGQLGGELGDFFDLMDVQVGQKFTLRAYQGGFKAVLDAAEPWRTATGHTFWLQGPREAVLAQSEVLAFLMQRCDDKNITLNLLLTGEGELPSDVVRQHRAGRLTVRWASAALPYRLIVCGDQVGAYAPPYGPLQMPASAPQTLWEAAIPLQGQDYREQAWRRGSKEGSGEGGLLDLELSVAMARLADALRPVLPTGSFPHVTPKQRERLAELLPQRAHAAGFRKRPILAAPLLEGLGLTPDQVNVCGNGVRVTQGGYLVPRPQDVGGQRESARYIGELYGGVIHHSQLRKLVEAFQRCAYEPTSFVTASLDVMGWAGNGYRRPRQGWEPQRRELTPFAAEVLAHAATKEQAFDWLRRNVAASEEQLARALEKAEVLAPPTTSPVAALSTAGLPQRMAAPHRPPPSVVKQTVPVHRTVPAPTPAIKPKFEALNVLSEVLPDPRQGAAIHVQRAVERLVDVEGPMTASWLVRRYAALAKLNPQQVGPTVQEVAKVAAQSGTLVQTSYLDGHVEYASPDRCSRLRECGERQAEDIPFGEWRELLRSLGFPSPGSSEQNAYDAAASAFRLGKRAAAARPLINLALCSLEAPGAVGER